MINRVKPANWAVGEVLSSAQMNGVDANTAAALDKRAGQTDTMQSIVTLSGAGRFVQAVATGPDLNSTVTIGSSNNAVGVSGLTAARTYTMSTAGAVAGDTILFFIYPSVGFEVTIKDDTAATLYVMGILSTSDGPWIELFFDGTHWRTMSAGKGSRLWTSQFTPPSNSTFSTTWTCPLGVTSVLVSGYGGGGGGGSGMSGSTTSGLRACGGGGGGGSLMGSVIVTVTPGTTYTVTVGGGGGGSASPGANGADGADTTLTNGGSTLALFAGASGGGSSSVTGNSSTGAVTVFGGMPVRGIAAGSSQALFGGTASFSGNPWFQIPVGGQGGWTTAVSSSILSGGSAGMRNERALGGVWTGGAAGGSGADNTWLAGAGGGGGAAGPGGNGGNGGAPSNGVNGGVAVNAGSGTAPSAVSGAGGGGGGGAGYGSAGGGTGGAGSQGGSGFMSISWVK